MTHTVPAPLMYEAMKSYWHKGRHRDAADVAGLLRDAALAGRIRLEPEELANAETIIMATEREEKRL